MKKTLKKPATKNRMKQLISLYVDPKVYASFKEKCEDSMVPYSRQVERLMADFIKNERKK